MSHVSWTAQLSLQTTDGARWGEGSHPCAALRVSHGVDIGSVSITVSTRITSMCHIRHVDGGPGGSSARCNTRPPEGGLTPTMAPLPTPLWLRSTRPPLRAVNGRVKAFTRPRKGSVKAVSPLSAESAGSTRGDTVLYHVGVVGALDLRVLRRRSQDPRGAGEDRLCRGHCIITSSPSALPEVACLARREM